MRAGLMKDTISILELQETKSPSGSVKKEWAETHSIKAYRRKLSASVGDGINASEEFIQNTIVFQVRNYPFITENIRIRYKSKDYGVILLDPQPDNSYLITAQKVNK